MRKWRHRLNGVNPMRGENSPHDVLFSCCALESRTPTDHPIRKVRKVVDLALKELDVL